jgi:hypothetical protein
MGVTTYDFTDSSKAYFANAPVPTNREENIYVSRAIIDVAKVASGIAASSTLMNLIDIPADTLVLGATWRTLTKDASAKLALKVGSTTVVPSIAVASVDNIASNIGRVVDGSGSLTGQPAYVGASGGHLAADPGAALYTLKGEVTVYLVKGLDAI